MNETALMTAAEVAERLGISYDDAALAIRHGEIPSARIGRSRRVPRQAFETWLQELNAEASARQTVVMLETIGGYMAKKERATIQERTQRGRQARNVN